MSNLYSAQTEKLCVHIIPSQWVTVASGANYPAFDQLGPVLEEVKSVSEEILSLEQKELFSPSN